jgi:hypothetical protein
MGIDVHRRPSRRFEQCRCAIRAIPGSMGLIVSLSVYNVSPVYQHGVYAKPNLCASLTI